ncbi:hypothetical protein HDU78_007122 [Chytriomyces hyalinus]|nr:hypothetical protein HDU78_007122 [Chytriomyces hyalinus]
MPFITVKYGANNEKLVNPDVQSAVLLTHIKNTCGFSSATYPIDLATETGEVIDLCSKSREYAKKYVEDRKAYIVVRVVGEVDAEEFTINGANSAVVVSYQPLLDTLSDSKLKFYVPEKFKNKQAVAHTAALNSSTGTSGTNALGVKDAKASKGKTGALYGTLAAASFSGLVNSNSALVAPQAPLPSLIEPTPSVPGRKSTRQNLAAQTQPANRRISMNFTKEEE